MWDKKIEHTQLVNSYLRKVKWNSDEKEAKACCPFHNDENPSLSVNIDKEIFYCHGCNKSGHMSELYSHLGAEYPRETIEDVSYDYYDAQGEFVVTVEKKVQYNGEKKFFRNPAGVKKFILYNLPDVLKAVKNGNPIMWVEGEKDVESLRKAGITATTTMNGANNYRKLPEAIKDLPPEAEVVLCGDADTPGHKYIQAVGKELLKRGISPKIITPEMMGFIVTEKGGKDVSDWLIRNKDVADLIEKAVPFDSAIDSLPITEAQTPHQEITLDEQGMAELMGRLFSNEIKYIEVFKSWYIYKSGSWKKDENGTVYTFIKKLQGELNRIADSSQDFNFQREVLEFIPKLRNSTKQKNILFLAQKQPNIACHPNDFDTNRFLFNVKNGTLDLKSGELLPHNPEHLITKISNVDYTQEKKPQRWMEFLNEIFLDDQEIIEFMQKYCGLALTGDTSHHLFCVFYGTGANGKSVFINTLKSVYGDYGTVTPSSTLMVKRYGEGISNDLARLKGARFVVSQESGDFQRLNEEKIKGMTGGDPIIARMLYGEFFEYNPEFKLVLVTNHRPEIKGTDIGIWRRVLLIPFEYTVPAEQQDRNLEEKLKQESQEILSWAVEGYKKLIEEGLNIPESIKSVTEEYRNDEDILGEFVKDCIKIHPASCSSFVKSSSLYWFYRRWADYSGERPLSQTKFSQKFTERGFKKHRSNSGVCWEGISLNPDWIDIFNKDKEEVYEDLPISTF